MDIVRLGIVNKWKIIVAALAVAAATMVGMMLFPQSAAAYGATLNPGESLGGGGKLESPNGQFVLIMQTDGNLVSYVAARILGK